MNKISTALLLSACLMIQGGAFAAEPTGADKAVAKKVAFDSSTESGLQPGRSVATKPCTGVECETTQSANSCGAYVSGSKHHGYAFGTSKSEATSKAREMCGPENNCQVVVAACED